MLPLQTKPSQLPHWFKPFPLPPNNIYLACLWKYWSHIDPRVIFAHHCITILRGRFESYLIYKNIPTIVGRVGMMVKFLIFYFIFSLLTVCAIFYATNALCATDARKPWTIKIISDSFHLCYFQWCLNVTLLLNAISCKATWQFL